MPRYARILGLCSAFVGMVMSSATAADAAATTPGATTVAKPAGYGGFGVSINSTFPYAGGWIGDEANASSNAASVDTLILCAS